MEDSNTEYGAEPVQMLAERDRTLVEQVRDRIVEFARTLWEIAQNYVDRMGRTEIAMLSSNSDSAFAASLSAFSAPPPSTSLAFWDM